MTSQSGPVYEVTFFMDRAIVDDGDTWLDTHVRAAAQVPGVVECAVCRLSDEPAGTNDDENPGRARRVCQYRLQDDDAVDRFLEGFGGNIDNEVADRFGDRVGIDARLLREDSRESVTGGTPDCLNCGTYLRGQYCAVCGQRARGRLISLWELVTDAFGDLFELDSRLWQTLIPLLVRPGRLTHDYLQGRRARYMPPFRSYLVLSLLFFVVAFFDPREDLSLLFEAQPAADAAAGSADEAAEEALARAREKIDDLVEEGRLDAGDVPAGLRGDSPRLQIHIGNDDPDDDAEDSCDREFSEVEGLPMFLQKRLTPERLAHICRRMQVGGDEFEDNLLDNIPAALIILLPYMALVLKVLYPLSRRYYVEHLLFFVHFHAFFFLLLTLQILFMRLAAWLHLPQALAILAVVVTSLYIPVYLFMSMRRVYGQGRLLTLLKYLCLVAAYLIGFGLTLLGATAVTAMSL